MHRSENTRREQGSAMIEATLTLMLFLILLFGIFDFGFTLFLHQTFVHQARSAARYGSVCLAGPVTCTTEDIKNMVLYNRTTGSGKGIMGLPPEAVTVTREGTPGKRDDRIVVEIAGYSFFAITPGWAGSHTGRPIRVSIPVEN
ncbi:MAG TPA: TadE/TadG family type IV pilus assembly protein [Bryobacteraceae bacterium]|nr:TadE/TadG family type IV pilus assembly protein [Bryobacteraceae bacterium]HOL70642.1 TadE/TadG family type IV pilus assembly protein [Bryobacteraceae bacterium]HOQ45958.1 TadE/TadG family type IV pilus assembly protein [Bryobacteraceae bacterium]HPU73223.1 TadE/TadG family type IV pilus assembly protein [Bryobacteraceae bacterium]